MTLSYKNFAKNELLTQVRNIDFGNSRMLFGLSNVITLDVKLEVNLSQLRQQADVFSREMITHRSKFDMKRILGSYQDDWLRLLHETYVYDRCKSIYYGVNSPYLFKIPENTYSFPGHAMLTHLLTNKVYQFGTNDSQPYMLYFNVIVDGSAKQILEPIFNVYSDVREGMSDVEGVYSYVNQTYETILNGLYNGKTYLDERKKNNNGSSIYEIIARNDDKIESFFSVDQFPFMNSFLDFQDSKFYFILPDDKSKPNSMRSNESLFLARALGLTCKGLTHDGNQLYKVSNRMKDVDPFSRDEMYSITGVKTELVPYSENLIVQYLGINTFKKMMSEVNSNIP